MGIANLVYERDDNSSVKNEAEEEQFSTDKELLRKDLKQHPLKSWFFKTFPEAKREEIRKHW